MPVYSCTLYCPYTAVLYTAHIQLFTCTVHARFSCNLYCPYTAVLCTAHIQLFTCTVHARIELYFILPIYSCTLYCPYTAFHLHCTCPYIAVLYIAHIQLYFILPYITINYIAHKHRCEPGSLVGIATAYGLDGPGIESRWCEIFRTSPDRP